MGWLRPNGTITWDVSLDGGFNQIADFSGRTWIFL